MAPKKGCIPWNKGKRVNPHPNSLKNLVNFEKGYTPWNKGKNLPKEMRDNISEALKGHIVSNETKEKLSRAHRGKVPWNKGIHLSEEHKRKVSDALKGKKLSTEHKENLRQAKLKNPVRYWLGKKRPPISKEWGEKLSKARRGEKNHQWLGGISFEPYGFEFNGKLKERVRKRDNYTCQECSRKQEKLGYKLHTHHVDYDKRNNQENNLISLCRGCHLKTNFNRKGWTRYFGEKYRKIW